MAWLVWSLTAAVFLALVAIANKKMVADTDILSFTVAYSWFATLLYLPALFYFLPQATLPSNPFVWLAYTVSAAANIFGILAINASLKHGEMSIVVPLQKLIPVFVAINAWLVLNESLTIANLTGIFILTAGSYIVLLKQGKSVLEPIHAFGSSTGAQMAVLSAVIYSFASIADRYAAQAIHPKIYAFLILLGMTISLTMYTLFLKRKNFDEACKDVQRRPLKYVGVGFVVAGGFFSIMTAYSLAEATKVVPVIQIQVLINVVAGGYLFKEDNILRKLVGSLLIIGGVVLAIL